jgi:hypothetical protein
MKQNINVPMVTPQMKLIKKLHKKRAKNPQPMLPRAAPRDAEINEGNTTMMRKNVPIIVRSKPPNGLKDELIGHFAALKGPKDGICWVLSLSQSDHAVVLLLDLQHAPEAIVGNQHPGGVHRTRWDEEGSQRDDGQRAGPITVLVVCS